MDSTFRLSAFVFFPNSDMFRYGVPGGVDRRP